MLTFRLGLYRDSEKQFKSAINQQPMIDTYLYLSKVLLYNHPTQCLSVITIYYAGICETGSAIDSN